LIADAATRYARSVLAGKTVAGPLVRAACKRHLADLESGPDRGLFWDVRECRRVIKFFATVLRLPDGDRAGQPFKLEAWQAFVAGSLFGWRRGKDGPRRYRTGYVETGKGSGKSPLGAGFGLYMLTADGERGAECYAAAVTRDQAQIPFRDAVRMVERSPALTRRLQKSGERAVFNLAYLDAASFFRPVSSEGRGLDGKRVHFALIDEVHEHPTDVVIEKITAGVKGRRQPLILEITNSGVDRGSICFQHHEYTERVVTGQVVDDEWFGYVCALDEGDEPLDDERCWKKANPSLGVTIQPEYLRKQVREAKGMPAKASLVRRLNFCQWVDAANPAIDGALWRACEAEFDEDALAGLEVVGGLDLSGTRDLTALARVYEPDHAGIVHAVVEFWTPADTLGERSSRDRVPYALWVAGGHVTATPGRAVDYAFVAQRISELQAERSLNRIAYDPYRIKYLERDIDELGLDVELVPHGQGYARSADSGLWMPRSVELLEELIGKGKLRVRKNPALTYAAASAVHIADPKANRIYDKRRSTGRIDGMVALAMAIGASTGEGPQIANVSALVG
jgi:phage terminase large subunit-like protein